MEAAAERCFQEGDLKGAACLYANLMVLYPQYTKMARMCRVLSNPLDVPLPYRYADVVEALLDPCVTYQTLFGTDAPPSVVRKAFQGWTLLVHPDKNPYPKAADAFNRLVAFKAAAMGTVDEGPPNAGGVNSKSSCRGNVRNRQRCTKRHGSANRANQSNQHSQLGDEIDMSLYELKKVQVTLKSLKRKNVDDSELPPLSAFLRPGGGARSRGGVDHSNNTKGSVPTPETQEGGSASLDESIPTSPRSCTADTACEPGLSQTIEAQLRSSEGATDAPYVLSELTPQQNEVVRGGKGLEGENTEEPLGLPTAGGHMQQYATNRNVGEVDNGSRVSLEADDSVQGPAKGIQNPDALPRRRGKHVDRLEGTCTGEFTQQSNQNSTCDTSSSEGLHSTTFNEDVPLVELAKLGIRELFDGIQKKINRDPIRLNCDLSFATYTRDKQKEVNEASVQSNDET
ncbi:hypothetical protein, conserved [Trypanosoma brucei brucei TREU927]|uniref:J domain-containing protein n=1 Tax=Trypanosoma brucei brucei (strain 927/4 GUTat10.1) TaxID=185431 RepID=Q57X77_TRYB2|nr:hypothetical protein, conserved [Trypanosoma brucei brucei TREU927]AAX69792.1 hypothetical protein, conserved [Trypanosoma brucei]AAZ12525.1 hypothetical protein, conserved [Trypanosoma brucei brucei TREU927]